jgi:hypothetical protein
MVWLERCAFTSSSNDANVPTQNGVRRNQMMRSLVRNRLDSQNVKIIERPAIILIIGIFMSLKIFTTKDYDSKSVREGPIGIKKRKLFF